MNRLCQGLLWLMVGAAKTAALVLFITDAARWPLALACLLAAWALVAAALWLRRRTV